MKRPLVTACIIFIVSIICWRFFILKTNIPAAPAYDEAFNCFIIKTQGSGYIAETEGGARVILYASGIDTEIRPGDILSVTGAVYETSPRRNPGGFDEYTYFAARGVYYRVYASEIKLIGKVINLNAKLNNLSEKVKLVYYNSLPEKEAAIISSIITGDRSDLPDDIKDLYSAGGIYHILAISGLHIGIIGLFLNTVLCRFLSKRAAGLIVIAALAFYCLFTGGSPSTVRAAIVLSVVLFGDMIYRMPDRLTSIGFAALCILIYNPYYLFDAGFILSFTGVLGIVLLSPPLARLFAVIGAKIPVTKKFFENFWVQQSLIISIAVNIAILPVCSGFLPRIPVYGVIVNIIVFPTFFLLVALGFAAGVIGLFYMPVAVFLCGGIFYLLKFYETVLNFFTNLPFSSILTGYIPLYIVIPYYMFVAAAGWYLMGMPFEKGRGRYVCITGFILAAAVFLHMYTPRSPVVTMLDTGPDGVYVTKKDSFTAIIADGGDNTTERVLLPYLDYLGVSKVNLVIIPQLEPGRTAGAVHLLGEKKADIVCLPADTDVNSELFRELENAVSSSGAVIRFVSDADMISYGDLVFEFINPAALRLVYKNTAFSFAGGLLNTEAPRVAFTCYGRGYNPPDTPLFETRRHGAVMIQTNGDDIKVRTMIND